MKLRHACSVLAASAVLLVSGAAFSGAHVTTVDQLLDYNTSTGELWAYPQGGSLATYLHSTTTQHRIANLEPFLPPDPCLPLARAWNFVVRYDIHHHVQSTYVFDILLARMSEFQCHASVTTPRNLTGTTPPIVSVAPVAKPIL
jgi:hypothetical protein